MKKNCVLLFAMTLIIAFCFTPSMMAKKISYMGYQYNGKINKENIPEGQGTITMSVQDLIDKTKTIDFSISGIFNGPNVTNANFSTTWLSYKGDIEIKDGNSFVLKKGGIITTNGYRFFRDAVSILPNAIKHYDIDVDKDTQISYSVLARIQMPYSYPFPKVPSKLNPPSEMTLYIHPSINKVLVQQTGRSVPSKIVYYNIADGEDILSPNPFSSEKSFEYKDTEGRIWKFNGEELSEVVYPDGSFCKKDLNFEKVSAHYVPKLKSEYGRIILDERIDNKPIQLRASNGIYENWDRYFSGVDSLLQIREDAGYIELYLVFDADYSLRESDVDKIDNFENMIKDKLLPNISFPDNKDFFISCLKDNDITKHVKVFSIKNGVILGRKQIAAAEKKAQQAKDAKEQAAYNQLCKQFGKKYVDAYMDNEIIIGMPEGLLKKYIHRIKSQSATSKTYYMIPYNGAPDYKRTMTVYVTNGRVTGFVDHNH